MIQSTTPVKPAPAPIEIDPQLYRLARVGQACRPRRCATDPARRRWYAAHRTARLAHLGA